MTTANKVDVLLVGGGIMSATLAALLSALDNTLNILMVEQLNDVALESSDALNNAGTGHAGYCELNYTPQQADGSIQIQRALEINAAFEVSLQFWSHLVETNALPAPKHFINKTPHLSFVWGEKNSAFLKQRHALLKQHPLFAEMQYSEDFNQLAAWMPLMMSQRKSTEKLAATYVPHGADVDFGALTRHLVTNLKQQPNFSLLTHTRVKSLKKIHGSWHVALHNKENKHSQTVHAKFVFLGAGGGALPLLQKTNIRESMGYGGFPVSGQWLICNNPEVIKQHQAKVYGKAAVGAPPMSVPHLDTRMINGKSALLFGPFAGFTTKFLKQGSVLDLAKSLKMNNLKAMLGVGRHNLDLTKYLVKETKQTHEQRMQALREFLPQAQAADWKLASAGQRVQIIKNCEKKWGKLEFGTEIVATEDGSLAALLGASPGASVSVKAMLDVIERCFAEQLKNEQWAKKLKALIPSYQQSLIDDADLLKQVRARTLKTLQLG
ncbi:MAG: malate dehydrogenase (quinone) [Methylotenera sp.]|uniref:malate dehydrogenase (quinone) n=1 Tax=Methylotenera sp. TaxID=2051956 RepID=UPI0017F2073A|nr:malate dehydrogenase (quinone) [Methylotenera sp.]NOU24438.1 malate dehydrogenase (quinone) [Methylotenera sp.]